ncbi:MAG: hypothetical protein AAFZ18_16985 [Myxococcota bacterium]
MDGSLLIGEGFVLPPEDASTGGGDDLGGDVGMSEDLGGTDLAPPDASALDLGPMDVGDPCAPEGLPVLTAESAFAMAADLDGQRVRLTGTTTVGAVICTDMPCPGGGICCNSCRADLFLGGFRVAPSECTGTSTVGCRGSPCDPLVCVPPLLVDLPAAVDGRIEAGPPARLELFQVAPP